MSLYHFSINNLFLILLLTSTIISCDQSTQASKPNIIYILVDDLGYGDVGFNGSRYYETPAIDELALESLVFDQAYMYPTCSPTRAALFTGKQSFRTGVYTVPVLERGDDQENIFSRWTVGQEHPLYSEPLAEVGYQSIHLGKWHIVGPFPEEELNMKWPIGKKLSQPDPGDFSWVEKHRTPAIQNYYPEGRGFVKNVGGTYRGDPALVVGGYKSESGGYWAPFQNPFIEPKSNDEWLTDRLTNDAIEFIASHKDQPFLVNLHYYTVHRPIRNRDKASLEKFMAKPGDPKTGQGLGKSKVKMAGYATMIKSLDDNIKKLIDYLDQNNLRDNTLIIFTSDNGFHGGVTKNKQFRGAKGHIYEGGIKVPALMNWPGKISPRRTDALISVLDYFPTLIDVADISYQGQLDGNSVTKLFQGDDEFLLESAIVLAPRQQISPWHLFGNSKGPFQAHSILEGWKLGTIQSY